MANKPKLELTWIGKENRPRLEPRILIEDPEKSFHAPHRISENDIFDNMLIHGDNLLALKALEQEYTGKVKCIYIDPPFNTQQAFEHYDDGLEHSLWLSLMRDRLEIIKSLLATDGTLFVHIDDNELGYLIVLLDEIFGRANRISVVTFKQGAATGHKAINPGVVSTSNFVVFYAKNKNSWQPNRIFTSKGDRDKRYTKFIENPEDDYSKWRFTSLAKAFAESLHLPERGLKKVLGAEYEEKLVEFVLENPACVIRLARPDYNAVSGEARKMIDESRANPDKVMLLKREGYSDMYFIKGERILFYANKLKKIDGQYIAGEPLTTIWDDVLSNNLHNEGGVAFPKGKKPEALIKRCFDLATAPAFSGDTIPIYCFPQWVFGPGFPGARPLPARRSAFLQKVSLPQGRPVRVFWRRKSRSSSSLDKNGCQSSIPAGIKILLVQGACSGCIISIPSKKRELNRFW